MVRAAEELTALYGPNGRPDDLGDSGAGLLQDANGFLGAVAVLITYCS